MHISGGQAGADRRGPGGSAPRRGAERITNEHYMCIHICIYTYTCICMYETMLICIIYIYIYIYMYICNMYTYETTNSNNKLIITTSKN